MLNIRQPIIQDGFLVNLYQINIRKLRQIRSARFSGHQSTEQHSASTTTILSRIFSTYGTYKSFSVCAERVSTESDTVYHQERYGLPFYSIILKEISTYRYSWYSPLKISLCLLLLLDRIIPFLRWNSLDDHFFLFFIFLV